MRVEHPTVHFLSDTCREAAQRLAMTRCTILSKRNTYVMPEKLVTPHNTAKYVIPAKAGIH
jgi:hypothetical protein